MYKTPGYKTDSVRSVEASSFGDNITADHVVIYRDNHQVIEEARLALVIKDVATAFMYAYPSALKDEMECKAAPLILTLCRVRIMWVCSTATMQRVPRLQT